MRTIAAFIRALRVLAGDDGFRALAGFAAGLLATGTVVYMPVEHWSPVDSLYFCVVTLATVGYGDLYPTTDLGKAFTIVYILTGVGIRCLCQPRRRHDDHRSRGTPARAGQWRGHGGGPPVVALVPRPRRNTIESQDVSPGTEELTNDRSEERNDHDA